jgi:hypothetical protein
MVLDNPVQRHQVLVNVVYDLDLRFFLPEQQPGCPCKHLTVAGMFRYLLDDFVCQQ